MAAKPVIRLDVGGTLTFAVAEGTPSGSPTVRWFDHAGDAYTTGGPFAATISGTDVTASPPVALVDDLGDNYRAEWTYVVGSTTYVHNQLFEVRAYGFFKTVTAARLAVLHPIVSGRPAQSTATVHANAITYAYDRIIATIRNRGVNPNKIVDPQPFEQALAAWSAWHVLRNLAPGSASTDATQALAADLYEDGRRQLEIALSRVDLYGEDDDGGLDSALVDTKLNLTIFTR